MFDIGFPELLIVSVVALLVLGPERLPEALRTLGLWFGRMRRSFSAVKVEIEREIGMDEVRRQLHNEAILDEMRALETDVGNIGNNLNGEQSDTPDNNEDVNPSHLTEHSDSSTETSTDTFNDTFNEPHPDDRVITDDVELSASSLEELEETADEPPHNTDSSKPSS